MRIYVTTMIVTVIILFLGVLFVIGLWNIRKLKSREKILNEKFLKKGLEFINREKE
jgi:fumarate reductase subunit D